MPVVMPTLTVQVAFASNPMDIPVWTDVSPYVRSFTTTRGRQFELDRMQAGTASVLLNNQSRRFDPYNTSSPYSPHVIPKRRIQILATWASVTYPVYSGYVEEWPQAWDMNGTLAQVQVTASDGFSLLGQAALNTTYASEPSGARVGHVLDSVAWGPSGNRSVATGTAFLRASTLTNTTALEHLLSVGESENGRMFMARDGVATFIGRAFGVYPILGTFGDGAGELPYTDLTLGQTPIWNDIRLTATGGVEQAAADAVSQAVYFRHSKVESGYLQASDSDLNSLANWWVSRYKDALQRVTSITIMPSRSGATLWPQVLGREIGDHIVVRRRPPGGGPVISQESVIEGISHSGSNGQWVTHFGLSPAEPVGLFMVIGTGQIGVNTVGV